MSLRYIFSSSTLLVLCSTIFRVAPLVLTLAVALQCAQVFAFPVADGPISIDSRIKTYIYSPTEVFPVTVHYGYSMHIDLRSNEVVSDIILGDNSDWSIIIKGNRIFIRANESGAHTNMTVITNKDVYEFDLYSRSADDGIDMDMAYVVRFFYPPAENDINALMSGNMHISGTGGKNVSVATDVGELLSGDVNYAFKVDGDAGIAPIVTFTDGKLTYFKFADDIGTIPLIYEVKNGKEDRLLDILQYSGYTIVNSSASKFILKKKKMKVAIGKTR